MSTEPEIKLYCAHSTVNRIAIFTWDKVISDDSKIMCTTFIPIDVGRVMEYTGQ